MRLRSTLRESALGEYGSAAIQRALTESGVGSVPSMRTIARILRRRGALDGMPRVRRPAPPRGWYLPDVAAGQVELDSFDVIEDHYVGAGRFDVLTAISLHGGLAGAWPSPPLRARSIIDRLIEHWLTFGQPSYAQFDNDSRFVGSSAYSDLLSPVVRLCLALSVVPVFAPPREHGFQAAIERFNGQWQTRVWGRRHYASLDELVDVSQDYFRAHRARHAVRIDGAPERRALGSIVGDLGDRPHGMVVFLRRTTDAGRATVLGRSYDVDPLWPHRLVRAELNLTAGQLSFFALRRREPGAQPLLAVHPYMPVVRHV